MAMFDPAEDGSHEEKDRDNTSETGNMAETPSPFLSIPEMLARCLQGLGRPLRVRIVQSLESKVSVSNLYTVAGNLITLFAS